MDGDSISEMDGHHSNVAATATGAANVVVAATGAAAFHTLVGAREADIDPLFGGRIRLGFAES
jgi:hypothetical protein